MYLAENFESDTDFFFDISQNWHRNKGCSGTINFLFFLLFDDQKKEKKKKQNKQQNKKRNSGIIPTLLCHSHIWSEAMQRLLHPKELLAAQGLPVLDDLHSRPQDRACLPKALLSMPLRALGKMAGNGWSVPSAGSVVFIMLLSCDIKVEDPISDSNSDFEFG